MEPNIPISPENNPPSFKSHFIEFFETLMVCLALGFIVYFFIAQPHKVSGSSMVPNFHNNDYIITNKLIYKFQKPERGQVIVFKNPRDNSQDFIKRIIGLPGEKVKIQSCHVYINDSLIHESYLDSNLCTAAGLFLTEGVDITVPADHYIVLGDNRMFSSDSREWGFIQKGDIIGEAAFRYWPQNDIGLINQARY